MKLPIYTEKTNDFYLFESSLGEHVLVVDGSRIYDINGNAAPCRTVGEQGVEIDEHFLQSIHGLLSNNVTGKYNDNRPLPPPPIQSLSLIVAQSCNMTCGYCYADAGKFGGSARMMKPDIAITAVDRLFAESRDLDCDVTLGFMGGEPLLNRDVVHQTTRYAAKVAEKFGRRIRFSITTNATLLKKEDIELFAEFPFTVAISIDGDKQQNDLVRQVNDGTSSYDRIVHALGLFSEYGRPRHLAARVTVTPKTGKLLPVLDHLVGLGFDEVGFSAVLVSPVPSLAFSKDDLVSFTEEMISCGRKALGKIIAGQTYPFGNFETALFEIHRGSHRPYPCGAGAAYLSVNAEGQFYACHRLIDDPRYAMGDIFVGSDLIARQNHLAANHVNFIEPCKNCWARYLCGGGCYHEVSRRGRIGCDYIRSWLDFCLKAYIEVSALRPGYFDKRSNEARMTISNANTIQEMD